MKRIVSFAILLFVLTYAGGASAQLLSGDMGSDSTLPKAEYGVKLGTNTQNISGNTWDNSYNTGISGGFWARMHKNRIGVRAEILASTFRLNSGTIDSAGITRYIVTDSAGTRGSFRALSLDIPVVLEITVAPKVLVQAGLQYTNLLSLSNITNISGDYKTLFTQSEFSGVIGIEVALPANFSLGARYRYGFTDINNKAVSQTTDSWKTTAFQLYACYKIK